MRDKGGGRGKGKGYSTAFPSWSGGVKGDSKTGNFYKSTGDTAAVGLQKLLTSDWEDFERRSK